MRDSKGRFIKGHSLGLRFGVGQKMFVPKKGQHMSPQTEFKKGQIAPNKDKSMWAGRKQNLKIKHFSGENHWNWKGGITPINEKIRRTIEYEEWRKAVFERDNYTCQLCGEIGGVLHADHIKDFSSYPEFRFELSNGRTLCKNCHLKTDNWGMRGKEKKNVPISGLRIGS